MTGADNTSQFQDIKIQDLTQQSPLPTKRIAVPIGVLLLTILIGGLIFTSIESSGYRETYLTPYSWSDWSYSSSIMYNSDWWGSWDSTDSWSSYPKRENKRQNNPKKIDNDREWGAYDDALVVFLDSIYVEVSDSDYQDILDATGGDPRSWYSDFSTDPCSSHEECGNTYKCTAHGCIPDTGYSDGYYLSSATNPWDFEDGGAMDPFFFVFTASTTIGYGNITPLTSGGQFFCIIWSLITIPLSIVCYYTLGHAIMDCFHRLGETVEHKMYTKEQLALRVFQSFDHDKSGHIDMVELALAVNNMGVSFSDPKHLNMILRHITGDKDICEKQIDQTVFEMLVENLGLNVHHATKKRNAMILSSLLLFLWWIIFAGIFAAAEDWSFMEGFYFTFVTLSTIGFGDYVPETSGGKACEVICTMVGLALVVAWVDALYNILKDSALFKTEDKVEVELANALGGALEKQGEEIHKLEEENKRILEELNAQIELVSRQGDELKRALESARLEAQADPDPTDSAASPSAAEKAERLRKLQEDYENNLKEQEALKRQVQEQSGDALQRKIAARKKARAAAAKNKA